MMSVDEFLKLIELVELAIPSVSEREKKIRQIIDLKHFMVCYHKSMSIIDCINHELSIVETNGSVKGIFFYDTAAIASNNPLPGLQGLKKPAGIEKLWFVFVQEKNNLPKTKLQDIISSNRISDVFDRIFLFQVYQSKITKIY